MVKKKEPIVAIWFTSTYEYDQRDFQLIQKYGNKYHPELGYYRSGDRKIMETQLDWIRKSGTDVIVFDCTSSLFRTPRDVKEDKTLKLLMELLKNQDDKKRKLYFCLFIERYVGDPKYDEILDILEYSKKNLVDFPYYFKKDGRPFFVVYANSNITTSVKKASEKYEDFDLKIVSGEYIDPSYARYVLKYPQELRDDWMPVSPGFDSTLEQMYLRDIYLMSKDEPLRQYFTKVDADIDEVRRNPRFVMKRESGEAYRKQLERAVKHNPEIIYISGWNDWQFGNHIEPAEEYGFKYIDLTAEILGRD